MQLGHRLDASARRTVRRRAPARRDRAGPVDLSADPARRRADRQSRLAHRRGDPRAHPRSARTARLDRRDRHARHEGRGELQPHDHASRRPHRQDRTSRPDDAHDPAAPDQLAVLPQARPADAADDRRHRARRRGVRRHAHGESERAVRVLADRRSHRRQDRAAGHGRRDRIRRGGPRDGAVGVVRVRVAVPVIEAVVDSQHRRARATCWCSAST